MTTKTIKELNNNKCYIYFAIKNRNEIIAKLAKKNFEADPENNNKNFDSSNKELLKKYTASFNEINKYTGEKWINLPKDQKDSFVRHYKIEKEKLDKEREKYISNPERVIKRINWMTVQTDLLKYENQ